jgi:hypothetical protein
VSPAGVKGDYITHVFANPKQQTGFFRESSFSLNKQFMSKDFMRSKNTLRVVSQRKYQAEGDFNSISLSNLQR